MSTPDNGSSSLVDGCDEPNVKDPVSPSGEAVRTLASDGSRLTRSGLSTIVIGSLVSILSNLGLHDRADTRPLAMKESSGGNERLWLRSPLPPRGGDAKLAPGGGQRGVVTLGSLGLVTFTFVREIA
jgi:hypothetical protein